MTKKDTKLHALKYWRGFFGLKQKDIALLIGCKNTNYCQKENGNCEIRLSEMLKIKDDFNKRLKKLGKEELKLDDIFLPK